MPKKREIQSVFRPLDLVHTQSALLLACSPEKSLFRHVSTEKMIGLNSVLK